MTASTVSDALVPGKKRNMFVLWLTLSRNILMPLLSPFLLPGSDIHRGPRVRANLYPMPLVFSVNIMRGHHLEYSTTRLSRSNMAYLFVDIQSTHVEVR